MTDKTVNTDYSTAQNGGDDSAILTAADSVLQSVDEFALLLRFIEAAVGKIETFTGTKLDENQEDGNNQNPASQIEQLQMNQEELKVHLAVAMETNKRLYNEIAEIHQRLNAVDGQLSDFPRLQQQVDGLSRAIAEALATGRLGNPYR